MSALHAGRQWTEAELDAEFGASEGPLAEVVVLPTGTSSVSENPRPLSLVPCNTEDEPEVRKLLRQHANGEIAPVGVTLPSLPNDATEPMQRVAEFFALVRGLRLWADVEHDPVPLSARFVGEHTGLHPMTANRALRRLCSIGVLKQDEPLGPRGARGTHTYLPGGAS